MRCQTTRSKIHEAQYDEVDRLVGRSRSKRPTINSRLPSGGEPPRVASFQASFQPGNDSARPSRMFILEPPQYVPWHPRSSRVQPLVRSPPVASDGRASRRPAISRRRPITRPICGPILWRLRWKSTLLGFAMRVLPTCRAPGDHAWMRATAPATASNAKCSVERRQLGQWYSVPPTIMVDTSAMPRRSGVCGIWVRRDVKGIGRYTSAVGRCRFHYRIGATTAQNGRDSRGTTRIYRIRNDVIICFDAIRSSYDSRLNQDSNLIFNYRRSSIPC